MRRDKAFRIIPALIGDFAHVKELSSNPTLLYIEAAVESLHAAVDVFMLFEEYSNSKYKKEIEKAIRNKYQELGKKRLDDYEKEAVQKIDLRYRELKLLISDGRYKDDRVSKYIISLRKELYRIIDIFPIIQGDPDYPDKSGLEEALRRVMRAYNKLLTLYIQEDRNNGQIEPQ